MAVFVLVLLTGMGTALLFLSRNESKMGQASLRLKKAFYLAESGIEDARVTLFQVNTDDDFKNELDDAAGGNDAFDLDPAALEVVYDANGTVMDLQGYGDDKPLRPLTKLTTPDGVGWYAAFLTNDAIDDTTGPDDRHQRQGGPHRDRRRPGQVHGDRPGRHPTVHSLATGAGGGAHVARAGPLVRQR